MLTVRHLEKRLPDGRALLHDISFDIGPKEFVGILGASGAGKSLTLRCLIGLTHPDAGSAVFTAGHGETYRLTDRDPRRLRLARRRIGVIFQGFNLVKRLTVLENVMMGRLGEINPLRSWLYGFTDREAREALAALERVKMARFADRLVGSLSGGEMQRVAIARAVHQRPAFYLADEPVACLDPVNSEAILELLAGLARETPVLGVFHQPHLTARYCTRVIAIQAGRIVYDGAPQLSEDLLAMIYGQELAKVRGEAAPAAIPAEPHSAPVVRTAAALT